MIYQKVKQPNGLSSAANFDEFVSGTEAMWTGGMLIMAPEPTDSYMHLIHSLYLSLLTIETERTRIIFRTRIIYWLNVDAQIKLRGKNPIVIVNVMIEFVESN